MKARIHMQDQVFNNVEAIMQHYQTQACLLSLMKVVPLVVFARLLNISVSHS